MNDYWAKGWKQLLAHNRLGAFKDLWAYDGPWFEPPNRRRGGWSGVCRVELQQPLDDGAVSPAIQDSRDTGASCPAVPPTIPGSRDTGASCPAEVIFLKRQQNHSRRTWRHPLHGEPTFRGEAANLRNLADAGIACPELVCYLERRSPEGWQVILATKALSGQLPLDQVIIDWQQRGWQQQRTERHRLLEQCARLVRRLHQTRRVHNALYPKHLFVAPRPGEVTLIDLEKMRRTLSPRRAMLRDLDSLNRHAPHFSNCDRMRFLLAYLDVPRLTPETKHVWQELAKRAQRKAQRSTKKTGP